MAKSLTAKVGAYSSVVGGGVHIHEPDGRFAGQVAFMCQTDTLRDKALQMAMSEVIAKALNELFAARQAPADVPTPLTDYERKVAQMKEDFPNGI